MAENLLPTTAPESDRPTRSGGVTENVLPTTAPESDRPTRSGGVTENLLPNGLAGAATDCVVVEVTGLATEPTTAPVSDCAIDCAAVVTEPATDCVMVTVIGDCVNSTFYALVGFANSRNGRCRTRDCVGENESTPARDC